MGGLTGLVLAACWSATMSLVVVAGTVAQVSRESSWYYEPGDGAYVTSPTAPADRHGIDWYYASIRDPLCLTYRWAVHYGIGGIPAAVILILFGLAALAPACYSAWVYSQKLSTHWPILGQSSWTWIGGAVAFVLGATQCADRLDLTFAGMGLLFAPALGAMVGEWIRQRGQWAGVRLGVNRAGIIAWVAGVGIALALEGGRLNLEDYRNIGMYEAPWWYSSSIFGFVASLAYYVLLAGLGRERPVTPIARPEIEA